MKYRSLSGVPVECGVEGDSAVSASCDVVVSSNEGVSPGYCTWPESSGILTAPLAAGLCGGRTGDDFRSRQTSRTL